MDWIDELADRLAQESPREEGTPTLLPPPPAGAGTDRGWRGGARGLWQPPSPPPPAEGPLVDTFGRVADDLRISVTDRCNFRCTYCMPAEGLTWLPKDEILTFEELTRLLRVFVERLGIASLKVTGGEPTGRAAPPGLL